LKKVEKKVKKPYFFYFFVKKVKKPYFFYFFVKKVKKVQKK